MFLIKSCIFIILVVLAKKIEIYFFLTIKNVIIGLYESWWKMKSKITTFIITIIVILLAGALVIFGIIMYDEIAKLDVVGDVKEFVSNITVSSGGVNKNEIQTPQILDTTLETISPSDEKIDYSNSSTNKYFFNQLDNYSKIIYNALEQNKENMKTGTYEINLGTEFSDILSNDNGQKVLGDYYQSAREAYVYDNPDVFYIDVSKLYLNIETTTRGIKKSYRVLLNSGNKTSYLIDEFPTVERINSALSEVDNDFQNVKLVHDYLVETVEYEQTISKPNIYNLYGALVNKECVCEGYAKAFKYLMDSLNIPCVVVAGKATNSEGKTENHAWNYVQLNGNWYAVDTTWDDPILIVGGILTNSSKYRYFLKGEDEFNTSHIPNGQFTEGGKVFTYPQLSNQNY